MPASEQKLLHGAEQVCPGNKSIKEFGQLKHKTVGSRDFGHLSQMGRPSKVTGEGAIEWQLFPQLTVNCTSLHYSTWFSWAHQAKDLCPLKQLRLPNRCCLCSSSGIQIWPTTSYFLFCMHAAENPDTVSQYCECKAHGHRPTDGTEPLWKRNSELAWVRKTLMFMVLSIYQHVLHLLCSLALKPQAPFCGSTWTPT